MENENEKRKRKLFLGGVLVLLVSSVLLFWFTVVERGREKQKESSRVETQEKAVPVNATRVTRSPDFLEVDLPGDARPYLSISLFARVSGAISEMKVDKGDAVEEHQILALIESPEVDQAYLAALALVQDRKTKLQSKRLLRRRRLISKREVDQAAAEVKLAEARLQIQEVVRGYKKIRAPFAGIVTARYLDPGALVLSAPSAQLQPQPLLTLSKTDRLRVQVRVDQADAPLVKPGIPAEIDRPGSSSDSPQEKISTRVTRISGELDAKTRTLLTEIEIENPKQEILAGSVVGVTLRIPYPSSPEVPSKSVVTREGKVVVPLIRPDQTLHYQEIAVGRSSGEKIRVEKGLKEGDLIALDVGTSLREGQKVRALRIGGMAGEAAPGPSPTPSR